MFSLTRKVSASAGDDWRFLLMWNELRVQIQFPSSYLWLSRLPMASGLNKSRGAAEKQKGGYVIANGRVTLSAQLFKNLVLLKMHSLARTTLSGLSGAAFYPLKTAK